MINWIIEKAISLWRRLFKPSIQVKERGQEEGQPVLLPLTNRPGYYTFFCPGCEEYHTVDTGANGHVLTGSVIKPTIKPSVLSEDKELGVICHSWITKGRIEFLNDCTHDMSGKILNLPAL